MNLLAIDTSSAYAFCAVSTADGVQREVRSHGTVSHNEELSQLTQRVLQEAGLTTQNLSGLVLGSGPGSFTGLRIGYSFAKGLALALRLPVTVIPSMQAIAQALEGAVGPVVVCADARREEVFVAVYERGSAGQVGQLLAPRIVSKAELAAEVSKCCGDAVPTWIVEPGLSVGVTAVGPDHIASGLLGCVRVEELQGFSVASVASIEPLYVRAVAARTIVERSRTT